MAMPVGTKALPLDFTTTDSLAYFRSYPAENSEPRYRSFDDPVSLFTCNILASNLGFQSRVMTLAKEGKSPCSVPVPTADNFRSPVLLM